jgi:hypothetical protein
MSWVETHTGLDGDPNHFEVYFYGGWNVSHETCGLTSSPRCSTAAWTQLLGNGQFDAAAIVFDPATPNSPPIISASDQGVFGFPGNGATSLGVNALWVWPGTVAGSVLPDSTHLYFGTQDNSILVSTDAGASWSGNPFVGARGVESTPAICSRQTALWAVKGGVKLDHRGGGKVDQYAG